MGCDFQILGSQPDIHIQERCIRFLENVMLEFGKTKDDLYTLIDSEAPIPGGQKSLENQKFSLALQAIYLICPRIIQCLVRISREICME